MGINLIDILLMLIFIAIAAAGYLGGTLRLLLVLISLSLSVVVAGLFYIPFAVWLKAERETTLKRFYHEGDRIRLQPANVTMDPIYCDPANVEVQGKLVGVLRSVN